MSETSDKRLPCGCDAVQVTPPDPRVAISAIATVCSHGRSDWLSIESEAPGFHTIPLLALIHNASANIAKSMDDDEDWMPHTTQYLFHYADIQSTNFCTALDIGPGGQIFLLWDPCMRRYGHFHHRVRATEWLLQGIAKENGSNDSLSGITVVVID